METGKAQRYFGGNREMKKFTTYRIATEWCGNNYILCNNIADVDQSIFDNARFDWKKDDGKTLEIYQYYITNATESDVIWLEETFGLLFTYSDLLDCFILCVDHLGTSWDCVPCEIKDDEWLKINPECEYKNGANPPLFETQRIIKAGK